VALDPFVTGVVFERGDQFGHFEVGVVGVGDHEAFGADFGGTYGCLAGAADCLGVEAGFGFGLGAVVVLEPAADGVGGAVGHAADVVAAAACQGGGEEQE